MDWYLHEVPNTLCDVVWPHSDIHDIVHPTSTSWEAATHVMLHHLIVKYTMCSMLLSISPKNSDQSRHHALHGIKRFNFRVASCMPSCLKFYSFYGLFHHLANISQFYSATFVCPFVSYLWPAGHTSIFILCYFTIQSLYIDRRNQIITTPQNCPDFISGTCLTLYFVCATFYTITLCCLSPTCHLLCSASLCLVTPHHPPLCQVEFFQEFSLYIYSLVFHFIS